MGSVGQQAACGLRWTTISQVSRFGVQVLGTLILAHLLAPSDFGLVTMATLFIGFAGLFRDFGTAAAIIQKPDISSKLLDSLFWLNILLGAGIATLLGLLAPILALEFSEPHLQEVLWLLLLIFPITSLGVVHQALLERSSRFRSLAIIESVAAFVGLGVAIFAAMSKYGVFSLVLQSLVTALMTTIGLWQVFQWRPKFYWDAEEIRDVLAFGGNFVGFNIFNYFIRNADNLLIGRFLGTTELGYYSMAYRLMLWPLQNISVVVGRTLFPLFSGIQADRIRLAKAYMRATLAIVLVTAPLVFGFFVLREPLVFLAIGEQWMPILSPLAWLMPLGLLQSLGTTVGTLYLATGRTDLMFKWAVAASVVVVPAFVIGLSWGITGVAAAYALASLLLFLPSLVIPYRLVNLQVGYVLRRLMPSLLNSFLMAIVIVIVAAIWPADASNQVLHLTMLVSLGVVVYASLSVLTQRPLLKDIVRLLLK